MNGENGKYHFHDRNHDWDDAWIFPRFMPPPLEKKMLTSMEVYNRSAIEEMLALGWRPAR